MINVNAIELLDGFDVYKNVDGEKAKFLEPVSKINIFVGSNNSGKSRFMRVLSSLSKYSVKQNSIDLESINSELLSAMDDVENFMESHGFVKINDMRIKGRNQ